MNITADKYFATSLSLDVSTDKRFITSPIPYYLLLRKDTLRLFLNKHNDTAEMLSYPIRR